MNRFTLNQLSYLSGIPDKTIIFWIKRYNVFSDVTKETANEVKYSVNHLNRLINISTLFHLDKKYALETICHWEDEQLQIKNEIELMGNLISKKLNEDVINQLVSSSLTYNEKRFNLIIDTALKKLTLSDFYNFIIYPFLLRIYDMFQGSDEKPVQFYYMKNLLKRKFYHLINLEASVVDKKCKVLLFLPENEFNEIGILFANLLLKQNGFETYYIGFNQNERTIKQAILDLKPDLLLTYLPTNENIKSYTEAFDYLADHLENLLVLATPKNMKYIKTNKGLKADSVEGLNQILEQIEHKKTELA
ncbi:MerR family transcriptional regulator [Faecalibacter sp. LW9]|uniref:MerR family transcriptional regulator n=1 Tax=Faecalibacter sp. LW9 TaxID=3103144 RepID=UPI002AFE72A8|nr:MerR family transcriptional regulator [Faecalibacter sp. LW9]